jgi:hypothetical protein
MPNTNVPSTPTIPFTIHSRVLVNKGASRGVLTTSHLEEVRDYLRQLEDRQQPKDHERGLDQLHVSFAGKHMSARFLHRDGIDKEEMLLTEYGAQQVAREVLPARFFSGLKDLACIDADGEKLATMTWAKFAAQQRGPRLLRTMNMNIAGPGRPACVRRVLRSCHSQSYTPYSNLQFVQDILDNATDFANRPVLNWHLSDTALRLRFAGCDTAQVELKTPIPMIEAWNSEVGLRRVGLRGGMWRLICTNGMGHWDEKREWSWIHRGDATRIRDGVSGAFEDLLVAARGVVSAYQQALSISIDNAFAWMEAELSRAQMPDRAVQAAQLALADPTVTPGANLASVVDAITLIAQNEVDVFDQYEVERAAAQVMARGLAAGARNGNRITVEA